MRRGAIIAAAVVVLLAAAAPAQGTRPGCDPIDPAHCLLPWPNDHFLKGGKLALRDAMMPRSRVPGLDLRRSGALPVNDLCYAAGWAGP